MVAVFLTSLILIAAILYALYRWQRNSLLTQAEERILPPQPGFDGLFGGPENARKQLAVAQDAEAEAARTALLERAARREKGALTDAVHKQTLYDEILNTLVEQADSDKKLLALVSYVTRQTPALRVNRRLAERFIESWKASPDRSSTAKMLHITALADDASLYEKTIETALQFWRERLIPDLSAEELRQLAESEYWILSQQVRSSGAGFLLKRKLAALRRELTKAQRDSANRPLYSSDESRGLQ